MAPQCPGSLLGGLPDSCAARVADLSYLAPAPRAKQVLITTHTDSVNCLVQQASCGPGPRAHANTLTRQNSPVLRAQLPGAGQEPLLKSGLSWDCSAFEIPRPPELTDPFLNGEQDGSLGPQGFSISQLQGLGDRRLLIRPSVLGLRSGRGPASLWRAVESRKPAGECR